VQIAEKKGARACMLRRAYRDLILFSLFIGSIGTVVIPLYIYLVTGEIFWAMMALINGLLGTLGGIAEFVFRVEFWRAIFESWQNRKRKDRKLNSFMNRGCLFGKTLSGTLTVYFLALQFISYFDYF